jgi:hypothetical protein
LYRKVDAPIDLQKHRITSPAQTITVTVPHKTSPCRHRPVQPDDRETDDNVGTIELKT